MVSIRITPKSTQERRDVSDPEVRKEIWDAAERAARDEVRANVRRNLRTRVRTRHAH